MRTLRMRWGTWALSLLSAAGLACGPLDPKLPSVDELRLPTAVMVEPQGRWLFVTQGNWDRLHDYSLLSTYDLAPINARWDDSRLSGCRPSEDPQRGPLCDLAGFAVPDATRVLPSGAGNIAFDRPASAPQGRLLIPARHQGVVAWMDLIVQDDKPRLECGQGRSQTCADRYLVRGLGPEPARLYLDDQGFEFAYLPHLESGRLSLIALRGPEGPELVDESDGFFSSMSIGERSFGGGFGLAQLPCEPGVFVPRASRECSRPLLYSSERFVYGLRGFSVATGRKVVLGGVELELKGHAEQEQEFSGWPTMGALWVNRAAQTPELFVVQHTPPTLLRLSLALDQDQNPKNQVLDALPLCGRADLMQAFPGPEKAPRLAVSCPDLGQLWIVDPKGMRLVGRVQVGAGANELFYEASRNRLWVTNTLEHSLSLVDVDPASPSFLQERLRLMHGPSADAVASKSGAL